MRSHKHGTLLPPPMATAQQQVNMSVAVIPMASELGWSATDRGLVSSAFFWGYSLTQVRSCTAAQERLARMLLRPGSLFPTAHFLCIACQAQPLLPPH